MKYLALLTLILLAGLSAQTRRSKEPEDITLPNGKKWGDVIAEAEHASNLRDATALVALTTEIRDDFEKSGKFVIPLKTLRKLEEAEKLVKTLRGRLNKN